MANNKARYVSAIRSGSANRPIESAASQAAVIPAADANTVPAGTTGRDSELAETSSILHLQCEEKGANAKIVVACQIPASGLGYESNPRKDTLGEELGARVHPVNGCIRPFRIRRP